MAELPKIDAGGQGEGSAGRKERKPYARPALRCLGSVRDLTLGPNGSRPDAINLQPM
jgi:hypothetical protein